MNIQIYCGKKNFDAQKAERYFKERRIPFQALDLKKHKLGEREIRMMISAIGIEKLIDREDKKVKEHPACYYDREELLIPAIQKRKQNDARLSAGRMGPMGIKGEPAYDHTRITENDAAGLSGQGRLYCFFRGLRYAVPFLP